MYTQVRRADTIFIDAELCTCKRREGVSTADFIGFYWWLPEGIIVLSGCVCVADVSPAVVAASSGSCGPLWGGWVMANGLVGHSSHDV